MAQRKRRRTGIDDDKRTGLLEYVGLNPGCTKYQLAKKLQVKGYQGSVPYSTIAKWIKELLGDHVIEEIGLGRTRSGLSKKGYTLTLWGLTRVSYQITKSQLLDIIGLNEEVLPIPISVVKRALSLVEDGYAKFGLMNVIGHLDAYDSLDSFNGTLVDILFTDLPSLRFSDVSFEREFSDLIIQELLKLNINVLNKAEMLAAITEDADDNIELAERQVNISRRAKEIATELLS